MVKVFLTGGTGFIGSRVVTALIAQGHTVSALSRRRGTALDELNVDVVLGSLRDLDTIAAAAAEADAVMHLGFQHDFTRYAECCQQDLQVVLAISRALAGSGKLFVSTSSTGGVGDTEDYLANDNVRATGERGPSERATLEVRVFLTPSPPATRLTGALPGSPKLRCTGQQQRHTGCRIAPAAVCVRKGNVCLL